MFVFLLFCFRWICFFLVLCVHHCFLPHRRCCFRVSIFLIFVACFFFSYKPGFLFGFRLSFFFGLKFGIFFRPQPSFFFGFDTCFSFSLKPCFLVGFQLNFFFGLKFGFFFGFQSSFYFGSDARLAASFFVSLDSSILFRFGYSFFYCSHNACCFLCFALGFFVSPNTWILLILSSSFLLCFYGSRFLCGLRTCYNPGLFLAFGASLLSILHPFTPSFSYRFSGNCNRHFWTCYGFCFNLSLSRLNSACRNLCLGFHDTRLFFNT